MTPEPGCGEENVNVNVNVNVTETELSLKELITSLTMNLGQVRVTLSAVDRALRGYEEELVSARVTLARVRDVLTGGGDVSGGDDEVAWLTEALTRERDARAALERQVQTVRAACEVLAAGDGRGGRPGHRGVQPTYTTTSLTTATLVVDVARDLLTALDDGEVT